MRKIIALLLITLLLPSCDIAMHQSKLKMDSNPFQDVHIISNKANDDTLYFLLLTDAHFNRELRDSGITRNTENLFSFLDKTNDLDAVLFLGDMTDDAVKEDIEALKDFIADLRKHISDDVEIISAVGNHDVNKGSNIEEWEEAYKDVVYDSAACGSYRIGNTVIYKLNSAYRLYGRDQLDYLDSAISSSDAKYNILLSHIPLSIKGFDQSLFEFEMADINERNRIFKIMNNKSGILFSGHHHRGAELNSYSDTFKELVLESFHARDVFMDLEGDGYYYLLELNQADGKATIYSFLIENDSAELNSPDGMLSFSI